MKCKVIYEAAEVEAGSALPLGYPHFSSRTDPLLASGPGISPGRSEE